MATDYSRQPGDSNVWKGPVGGTLPTETDGRLIAGVSRAVDADGNEFLWSTNGWNQTSTSGAAYATIRNTLNVQTYDADKAASTSSAREAIPTGAQWLNVSNESTTIAEAVRFAFGDSSLVALATSGYRVRAAGTNVPPGDIRVPVPADATHWAYIAESGTPTINVIWE